MKLLHTSRHFGKRAGRNVSRSITDLPAVITDHLAFEQSPLLRTVAWVSAGVGALAIGVVVGREIRLRYKFNRRTPYDLYAHSGDRQEFDRDFGLGI